uniref:histone acetyltransferase n=1 Tax=Strongyloides stercoralis TaxID=6248 RepID=A0A0K0E548_STRER
MKEVLDEVNCYFPDPNYDYPSKEFLQNGHLKSKSDYKSTNIKETVSNPNQKLCAPFLPCTTVKCDCQGFSYNGLETFDLPDQLILEECYGYSLCSKCQHPLEYHVSQLNEMTDQQLEIMCRIVMDCRDVHDIVVSDDDIYCKGLAVTIRDGMIECLRSQNFNLNENLKPEFDFLVTDTVNLVDLVSMVKYNVNEQSRHKKVVVKLLDTLNDYELPPPDDYINCDEDPQKFIEYVDFYKQWLFNVIIPQKCNYIKLLMNVQFFGATFLIMMRKSLLNDNILELDCECLELLGKVYDVVDKVVILGKGKRQINLNIKSRLMKYEKNLRQLEMDEIRSATICIDECENLNLKQDSLQVPNVRIDGSKNIYIEKFNEIVEENAVRPNVSSDIRNDYIARVITTAELAKNGKKYGAYLSQFEKVVNTALPNMGKDYVNKVVFDFRHKSIIVCSKQTAIKREQVIAGICFREFKLRGFIEIVFCVVQLKHQSHGFGSFIMDLMKTYSNHLNIPYLLTYADNKAAGYFFKHGFVEDIELNEEYYKNYIKHYDGAKLMGVSVIEKVDYTLLKDQIEYISKMADKMVVDIQPIRLHVSKTYAGIEHLFKESGRGNLKKSTIVSLSKISGFERYNIKKLTRLDPPETDFEKKCQSILKELKSNKNIVWPFESPVSEEEVPGYHSFIDNPIDLSTIKSKLDKNGYSHEYQFVADIKRMFDNCYRYNGSTSPYYAMAYLLNKKFNVLQEKYFPDLSLQAKLPEPPTKEALEYCR